MIHAIFLLVAQQYDHGNPTADEQFVLEMINRARADTAAEQARIKGAYPAPNPAPGYPGGLPSTWTLQEGISPTPPTPIPNQPPLAFNASLIAAARGHSLDMWNQNYFDHFFPAGTVPPASTSTPTSRMSAAGYVFSGSWRNGENIATASALQAAGLEDLLVIDAGVSNRGHRINLLDIGTTSPYREIGLGYLDGGADQSNIFRFTITQDFARVDTSGPFLVGVVYWDKNSNSSYDQGEGLGGVKITVSGTSNFAITSSSGGYAIPVPTSGTVTVTATGFNLPSTLTQTNVVLGPENVKMDFGFTAADSNGNGLPDYWETRFPTATNPAADTDGNGYTNLAKFLGGADPTNPASIPVPLPGSSSIPPPGGSGSSGGGGKSGCGMTGLEGALVLWLAALARRGAGRARRGRSA
jgi:hypothetical protein